MRKGMYDILEWTAVDISVSTRPLCSDGIIIDK